MDQPIPGFVPRFLRDDAVGLFRADERVFNAMVDGWSAQMLARGLQVETIKNRCGVVRRFQTYSGKFPWTWRPVDIDDYMGERRSGDKPISLTTLRADGNAVAMFCSFGALAVRWAKGTAGSGPRRRTVLTVPKFDWSVGMMQMWTSPGGRDRFATADRSSALWPSERGDRVTVGGLGDAFTAVRDAAGLPEELGLHCLRHSYVTHLIEAGYDPAFVQTQVGHSYASTTSLYTSVSADFKQKTVQKMIARRIGKPEERSDA